MSIGRSSLRMLMLVFVVLTLATACRATPTATAVTADATVPTDPSEAVLGVPVDDALAVDSTGLAPAFTAAYDTRIDFRLTRTDINCGANALTEYDNSRVISAHYVVDGKLGARCLGQTNEVLINAWKVLVSTAPEDHLQQLGIFVGYTNELDIPAHLSPVGTAGSLGWYGADAQLSIDLDYAFADLDRLTYVLVHEMGHVLSGSRSQATILSNEECPTFYYGGMCFEADSLFLEFVALFWANYLPELDPNTQPSPESGRWRCERDSSFFNPYAASDPFEDFAESYATFVMGIQATTPGQQAKLNWFAGKGPLVAARDRTTALVTHSLISWPPTCG